MKQPLYEQIERQLRRRLEGLQDGARFTSEPQLAAEFGVARMTVRAALDVLERDGLLERVQGRGSFVRKSPASRRVAQLVSFHDQAVAAGKTPRSRTLYAACREATIDEARALGGTPSVVAITRVRCMDDLPVALEHAVFVPALSALLDLDLENDSVHSAIRVLGYSPAGGRSILSARNADDHADELQITRDAALLVETRTIHDTTGDPIEYTSSAYVPQRYSLSVDFTISPVATR